MCLCTYILTLSMREIVDLLKVLSDETRLRLVKALQKREFCVCELVDALQVPQYNISRHLSVLRKSGLVEDRKEGIWVYYRITPHKAVLVKELVEVLAKHLKNEKRVQEDERRLEKRIQIREGGKCVKSYGEF